MIEKIVHHIDIVDAVGGNILHKLPDSQFITDNKIRTHHFPNFPYKTDDIKIIVHLIDQIPDGFSGAHLDLPIGSSETFKIFSWVKKEHWDEITIEED